MRAYVMRTFRLLVFGGCVAACAGGAHVRAQEEQAPAVAGHGRTVSEKIDEFVGRLGHCDLTARLDNFAIMLQNEPGSKGYLVGYDSANRRAGYVDSRLRMARYYMTQERGIDASRVTFVNGGSTDREDILTELWIAPAWAGPPVPVPEPSGVEFAGKFDEYVTDENQYRELVEMGVAASSIAYHDFAEKLKAQKNSVGYIVVRGTKRSLPGAWRRVARRDERILRDDYEVDGARLKSIDGGQTEGESATVEFWVLPKDAPPPPGITEKLEPIMKEAYELNRLGEHVDPEAGELDWALDNIAEVLGEDPDARACLIVRQYEPGEEFEESVGEEPGPGQEAKEPPFDPQAVAEKWKRALEEKYGVAAHRVFVMVGRPKDWGMNGHLSTWVVPKNAPLPDPQVVTKDEEAQAPEEEEPADTPAAPAEPPPTQF